MKIQKKNLTQLKTEGAPGPAPIKHRAPLHKDVRLP